MKKIFTIIVTIALSQVLFAQQKPAYVLYNATGKKIGFDKMIAVLRLQDIVLFGELHNNPIAHWLQLEVTKELGAKRQLVMGAEMFEQDNQHALDLYLRNQLSAKGLDSMARLWKNYSTDYAPLVDYAKDNHIAFAASNIPRRYASLVSHGGFEALDTLTASQKEWIAPLPILYDSSLPGYKKMIEMMPGHGAANFPKAQAIKDATMAHFILKYFEPGKLFIHFNGAYHSENNEGIVWYLKKQQPSLKYSIITTVLQKDLSKLLKENKGKADFIICVDEDMTTTY